MACTTAGLVCAPFGRPIMLDSILSNGSVVRAAETLWSRLLYSCASSTMGASPLLKSAAGPTPAVEVPHFQPPFYQTGFSKIAFSNEPSMTYVILAGLKKVLDTGLCRFRERRQSLHFL